MHSKGVCHRFVVLKYPNFPNIFCSRDIRLANILKLASGRWILIDYEAAARCGSSLPEVFLARHDIYGEGWSFIHPYVRLFSDVYNWTFGSDILMLGKLVEASFSPLCPGDLLAAMVARQERLSAKQLLDKLASIP